MTEQSTPACSSSMAEVCRLCLGRHSRHTSAMHTLQATRDVRKVSLWLGHASLQSTEIYQRADPTEKLEALAAMAPPSLKPGRFRSPDKLLAMLKSVSRSADYVE
ncbi:MAG: hypothetical protein EOR21_24885 [Mesorhizobium sp.]|nr:MAG: hypothetical protein EOR21_24885 [Mesorhizobium sp.]